jgi:hypothetical protein
MATKEGPKMVMAQGFVLDNPGCLMAEASLAVAPARPDLDRRKLIRYGAATVTRAIQSQLLRTGSCEEARCARPHRGHVHLWGL